MTESESAVLPLNYLLKKIARRNTQALVTVKTDYRLATPLLATPGEALGESIDLIVVATGKREQLSDEFFQPSGAPGKTDRSSGLNGAVRASSAGR